MPKEHDEILLGPMVARNVNRQGDTKETRDRDGDGVPDLQEMSEGTDADDSSDYLGAPSTDEKLTRDRDGDGVPDLQEMSEGTDADDASDFLGAPSTDEKLTRDTDGDGVPDMQERSDGTDHNDASDYLGAPDLVLAGLTADLGADLVAVPDEFESRRHDDGAESTDELVTVDGDDMLDD